MAALCRGVIPSASRAAGSAPCSINVPITSYRPQYAARCRGVPASPSRALTRAPWRRRSCATASLPFCAAACSAVHADGLTPACRRGMYSVLTRAPCLKSFSTCSKSPSLAASTNEAPRLAAAAISPVCSARALVALPSPSSVPGLRANVRGESLLPLRMLSLPPPLPPPPPPSPAATLTAACPCADGAVVGPVAVVSGSSQPPRRCPMLRPPFAAPPVGRSAVCCSPRREHAQHERRSPLWGDDERMVPHAAPEIWKMQTSGRANSHTHTEGGTPIVGNTQAQVRVRGVLHCTWSVATHEETVCGCT